MFEPKTDRIENLAKNNTEVTKQLESLFIGNVNMYIDYANVRPWSNKLGWHIDVKRLKQFFDSFDNVDSIKFYNGTLEGDKDSEDFVKKIVGCKYDVKTKPVKLMKISIDVSSISSESTDLLNNFIRSALIKKYDIETIEYLNKKFKEMNNKGIFFIEDRKCNFDVEIGRDMLLDYERNNMDTYVLWSGDSDFADPIKQLLDDGKNVILFATSRRVSSELNNLISDGLFIFDIQKIRNFICWKKEMQKGPPKEAPKL